MAIWTRHFHNSIKYFRAKTVGSRATVTNLYRIAQEAVNNALKHGRR